MNLLLIIYFNSDLFIGVNVQRSRSRAMTFQDVFKLLYCNIQLYADKLLSDTKIENKMKINQG